MYSCHYVKIRKHSDMLWLFLKNQGAQSFKYIADTTTSALRARIDDITGFDGPQLFQVS